jgi:hypothetical protein
VTLNAKIQFSFTKNHRDNYAQLGKVPDPYRHGLTNPPAIKEKKEKKKKEKIKKRRKGVEKK